MDLLRSRRKRATSIAQSSDGIPVSGSVSPPEIWVDVPVDISTTDYARRRRELMEMMADLRSMGYVLVDLVAGIAHTTSYSADALIDLPAVVVIGGQSGSCFPFLESESRAQLDISAGKSSLVEAVSGVCQHYFVFSSVFFSS